MAHYIIAVFYLQVFSEAHGLSKTIGFYAVSDI
jgi:hypothetical protein